MPLSALFATISGAHLYGFPSPDSDYDLRGVHILPLRRVVGLDPGPETIEANEVVDGLEVGGERRPADQLGGALRGPQRGVLVLQLVEAPDHPVVLGVAQCACSGDTNALAMRDPIAEFRTGHFAVFDGNGEKFS